MRASSSIAILAVVVASLTACTTGLLRPDHWLVWRVDDFKADERADEVRWTYSLVLENRGRQTVNILRGFASVALGTVQASPDEVVTRKAIPAGQLVRIPHAATFRSSDFHGSDLRARKVVKWQFWGNYEDGEAFIINADVDR